FTFTRHGAGHQQCDLQGCGGHRRKASSLEPMSEAQFDAEIIAVGSEMLTSQRIDTNSLYLTDLLNSLGVEVKRKVILGDDRALLTSGVNDALSRVKILILSGGLGPTEDD